MRRVLAGLVLAALTVGCSGSGGGAPESTPGDPSRSSLERAVHAYSVAYLAGHGDAAYAMLSSRCQQRIARAELRGAAAAARSRYGDNSIKSLTVDSLSGTSAAVTYTYADPAINQTAQRWVFEGGAWRYDQC